jgi:UTP--glucose-1-phosphate uridylyltransferase
MKKSFIHPSYLIPQIKEPTPMMATFSPPISLELENQTSTPSQTNIMPQFAPFAAKMQAEGLPDLAIATFAHYYQQLLAGETGLMPESCIEPVTDLPSAQTIGTRWVALGHEAQAQTVLLKLNGGLGTSMGLEQAKALLPVRDGLTFLDIIAQQAMTARLPLVLMNSFNTRDDSLAALAKHPNLQTHQRGVPFDFLQHKVPKVVQADFTPAAFPADPALEWCPPGHGDLYTALMTSGLLAQLLAAGVRYAFIANADNLGATFDPALLGYFVQMGYPFMMEVATRTPADRKGGHLARRRGDGQLLLRESAQVGRRTRPCSKTSTATATSTPTTSGSIYTNYNNS